MPTPKHIIKKSRTWYYDTVLNKHIHKDALDNYIKKRRQEMQQTKLAV